MKISVIICTCNGSERLKGALKSLKDMEVASDIQWELLVIDNNSSDDTCEVIKNFARASGLNVKYLFEGNQGLSYARNRGLMKANGEIIAFTDDDCIVDKSWITSILKEFASDKTLLGLGGRVELYNVNDRPVTTRTFKDRMLFSSPNQLFNLLPGCNMAFAREVFDDVGEFDPNFGAGTKIASAEDSDFFYRVHKKGFKMIYSPDVLVYHNHGRRTDSQVRALNRGYVIGRGAFYCKHILRGDPVVMRLAYREISLQIKRFIRKLYRNESIEKEMRLLRFIITGAIYKLGAVKRFKQHNQTVSV